jgi:hypothetical protein
MKIQILLHCQKQILYIWTISKTYLKTILLFTRTEGRLPKIINKQQSSLNLKIQIFTSRHCKIFAREKTEGKNHRPIERRHLLRRRIMSLDGAVASPSSPPQTPSSSRASRPPPSTMPFRSRDRGPLPTAPPPFLPVVISPRGLYPPQAAERRSDH